MKLLYLASLTACLLLPAQAWGDISISELADGVDDPQMPTEWTCIKGTESFTLREFVESGRLDRELGRNPRKMVDKTGRICRLHGHSWTFSECEYKGCDGHLVCQNCDLDEDVYEKRIRSQGSNGRER